MEQIAKIKGENLRMLLGIACCGKPLVKNCDHRKPWHVARHRIAARSLRLVPPPPPHDSRHAHGHLVEGCHPYSGFGLCTMSILPAVDDVQSPQTPLTCTKESSVTA